MAISQAAFKSITGHNVVKSKSDVGVDTYSAISTQSSSSTTASDSLKLGLSAPTTTLSTYTDAVASAVRRLKASEIDQAAECLADAFRDDELAHYFTHTPDRKPTSNICKLHLVIMKCIVRAHVQCGLATVIGENYDCVALWMPPGKDMDGLWPMLRSGMNRLHFLCRDMTKEGRIRFFDEFLPTLHEIKHQTLQEHDGDSWYLVYIGTKPGSRKRGYAKRLIEDVTRKAKLGFSTTRNQADEKNQYCYLESTNVANARLYNKLGFAHQSYIHFKRSTPHVVLDVMTRVPRALAVQSQQSGQPLAEPLVACHIE